MEIINSIRVEVEAEYLDNQSIPDKNKYVFAYHITISNIGDEPAQLINRYWLITDGEGKKSEVAGSGVIGEQPTIKPGKKYSYSSGCVLDTPVGTMEGHYEMQLIDQSMGKASIPVFRLSIPNIVH